MKITDWISIKNRLPDRYKKACDICINIERMIKSITIGLRQDVYLAEDIINLRHETKRLLAFILSEVRVQQNIDNKKLKKLEEDLQSLIRGIKATETEKFEKSMSLIRDITNRKSAMIFYLSDYKSFLGIFYDTLKETIMETEKSFGKNFSNILLRKTGLYPEVYVKKEGGEVDKQI
ncbi:MAG: hypothetical protein ACTSV7_00855 [Candidatus Baldrarchaeia archaeon]